MFWIIRIYQIPSSQNKALKTPFICSHLPTRIAFSNAVATDAVNRHKSDACLRSPHRKQIIVYVGVPIGVGEYECKDTKIF